MQQSFGTVLQDEVSAILFFVLGEKFRKFNVNLKPSLEHL